MNTKTAIDSATLFAILALFIRLFNYANGEGQAVSESKVDKLFSQLNFPNEMIENIKSEASFGKNFSEEITPQLILENYILTSLCQANVDGNYQNPFNCTKFFMCSGGTAFLWECPGPGAYYPIQDVCLYLADPAAQCPWRTMWYGEPSCATIGLRNWWSPLTIPVDPSTHCLQEVQYCFNGEKIGTGSCPSGYGYCKAYNACLPVEICLAVDYSWNL